MMSILLIICTGVVDSREIDYPTLRQAMVEVIEASVLRTAEYIDKEALDPRVMEAMGTVPRHEFVPEAVKSSAYEDRPLPIGQGQTISQPYIVALMTDLMHPGPEQKVLEVGTGSGYQAAVLAELIDKVYTIEIIEELGEQAADRFHRLGYDNITPRVGDGYYGWEEHAPFDAILVTAASSHIPPPLIKQLKPGGRMVIPVGGHFMVQQLVLIEKTEQGKIITHQILPVRFVPLTGDH
ncbi:protein-L-isoaspartate O-methyltransferase [bacterium endosymbiont of Escarpia laminata]|nr:MAG: protein-L-isoaspartate O-methyltransferase [bacterium endosymbiont of Escarpia laminata]